jgi:hypothetical protein
MANSNRSDKPARMAKGGWLKRGEDFLAWLNQKITFIIGLPVVGLLGTVLVGHFQYLTAYQDKVKAVGTQQVKAAEETFADVSMTFSKAITLQQLLLFNYRDALNTGTDADDSVLEAKNARAIYPKYDELRTSLRENIDLMARRVEADLDWASNTGRDGAKAGRVGLDPISRIKLGAYDFDCENDKTMPSFKSSIISLPVPAEMKKENPAATPLGIDWYSAKHELLTLYFCFDKDHGRIEAARRWAAKSPVDNPAKKKFAAQLARTQDSFDREAVRLDAFLTMGAREIEAIHVKFRPRAWYCHMPIVRQVVDFYSRKCSPIHTAQAGSVS